MKSSSRSLVLYTLTIILASAILAGCEGDSDGGQNTPAVFRNWVAGEFSPSAGFRDLCVNPRTGNDPFTGRLVPDRAGRAVDEKNWLRSIHNEFYLWYDEILDIYDPADTTYSTAEFYDLQITPNESDTMSGKDKDEFHFSVNRQEFFDSIVMGVNAGYGAEFRVISTSPNEVAIAYVEPDSPATDNGLGRGARIISVDGEDIDGGDVAVINAGLFPATVGESHTFIVRDLNAAMNRTINMTSAEVASTPVQNVTPLSGNIGYLLFNAHIATAETQLIDAINQLLGVGVTDLILDVRYNGGGFLDIASELAYMIGGDVTDGLVFERLHFNDKFTNATVNPLTGGSLTTPFHDTVQGFSEGLTDGDPLPTLNASNVVIITSGETCSASEAIINGLRAVPDINLFLVGTTTCGKPYGNVPLDNCGINYLFTQFEGTNNNGEGGFSDGFEPQNTGTFGIDLPGCAVADDFDNDFDAAEANISVAIDILTNPTTFTCPTPPPVPATAPPPSTNVSSGSQKPTQQPQQIQRPQKPGLKLVF